MKHLTNTQKIFIKRVIEYIRNSGVMEESHRILVYPLYITTDPIGSGYIRHVTELSKVGILLNVFIYECQLLHDTEYYETNDPITNWRLTVDLLNNFREYLLPLTHSECVKYMNTLIELYDDQLPVGVYMSPDGFVRIRE